MPLDLTSSSVDLTRAICDIPSVSGDERLLADEIERALICADATGVNAPQTSAAAAPMARKR